MAKSLVNYDPRQNDGRYYRASWRALALGLWEYRRGNYTACLEWLQKCSEYPDQSVSCVAGAHSIRSMVRYHLGATEAARTEFTAGKTMAEEYFEKKLELGNDKEGRLAGWIMNSIFLREAELVLRPSVNSQGSSEAGASHL